MPLLLRFVGIAAFVATLTPSPVPATALELPDAVVLHTQLEESRPADEDVLSTPPTEIWLRFSTAVQRGLSTIELRSADGSVAALSEVFSVEGSEDMQLRAVIDATLTAGDYVVSWTTAGPDSHIIEGTFGFTLQGSTQETAPDSAATQEATTQQEASVEAESSADEVPQAPTGSEAQGAFAEATAPLGLIARWFGFLGSVLLIGIGTFHIAVVGGAKRRGEAEAVAAFLPRLRGYAYVIATLALAASLLRVADGINTFGFGRIGALMFGSPWGMGLWIYVLGAVAAFVGVRITGRTGTKATGWTLLTVGGLLTAVSMPFAGHGWAEETRALAAPSHMLHTIGAGMWLGSLGVLVLVALPFLGKRRDAEGRSAEAPAWVASFSRIALIGVGLLLLTGALNSWLHVGGIGALFGSAYGRTLLVKEGVLVLALLLGLYNWKQARPALDETGRPGIIQLPATIELALGIGVLLVTAVLVAMHLPA